MLIRNVFKLKNRLIDCRNYYVPNLLNKITIGSKKPLFLSLNGSEYDVNDAAQEINFFALDKGYKPIIINQCNNFVDLLNKEKEYGTNIIINKCKNISTEQFVHLNNFVKGTNLWLPYLFNVKNDISHIEHTNHIAHTAHTNGDMHKSITYEIATSTDIKKTFMDLYLE
jgi:hypothetical protein